MVSVGGDLVVGVVVIVVVATVVVIVVVDDVQFAVTTTTTAAVGVVFLIPRTHNTHRLVSHQHHRCVTTTIANGTEAPLFDFFSLLICPLLIRSQLTRSPEGQWHATTDGRFQDLWSELVCSSEDMIQTCQSLGSLVMDGNGDEWMVG